ncbi:hypothetical protein [Palleronia abyssalis]|uniref:Uncharacterized protein n=1 Tax=Palleronia abyssalis TaxID=1501240 RepID=A0A2R8C0V2_9RHOB|nr:hypothetical protein [Palleronia abyssalis]SPJ25979.1 hypothetical protein PAA8504_03835 [Palleronia abyssalis]
MSSDFTYIDDDSETTENKAAAGAIAGAAAGAIAKGGDGGEGGNATVNLRLPEDYGSDDDTIDADQTNNGDNQANAVRSTVNQSDDDGDNRNNDNSSDDDTDVDVRVSDALNDNGDNRDNDIDTSLDNVLNGNGDNRDNDHSTDTDITVDDTLNGNGHNRDNDYSTNLDNVANKDLDLDLAVRDAFNTDDSDTDLLDWNDVGGFEIDSLIADALNGAGNDMAFSLDQTNQLTDNDRVSDPDVIYNGGTPGGTGGMGGEGDAYPHAYPADAGDGGPGGAGGFYQTANANGGTASMHDFNAGGAAGGAGDDAMDMSSMTSADAALTQEAFTQNLTLGANIQYNLAEMSVVGGNSAETGSGEDDVA